MGRTTDQVGLAMAWSVLARAGRFALGIASSVIVVRSLGEHDYGVLSLVRTVLMFVVVVVGAGLGQAVLKFLPALRVDRAGEEARALLRGVTGADTVELATNDPDATYASTLAARCSA